MRWVLIGVGALLIALVGWCAVPRGGPGYQTAVVDRGVVERSITASGTVRPLAVVQVGAQVSGQIMSIAAEHDQPVARGQLLATIDPTTPSAELERAAAGLARAEADERQAVAGREALRSDLELRRLERERQRALAGRGFTTRRALDETEAAVRRAEAQLAESEARIAVAAAERRRARAQRAEAGVNVGRTRIVSPIDGVVVARFVDPGQTLTSVFQTPVLFEIAASLERMQVEARVDEADIGEVRAGQQARFSVDAWPDRRFEARVSQVRRQPEVQQGIVTYAVILEVDNREGLLLPGMTATVDIVTGRRAEALRVPVAALSWRPPDELPARRPGLRFVSREEAERLQRGAPAERAPRGASVWRLAQGAAEPVEVPARPGLAGDTHVELTAPALAVGDRVVIGRADRAP